MGYIVASAIAIGSLHDYDLYETFLDYVRDLKRERRGIREIEVAVALRKADDEALATSDLVATFWVASHDAKH